MTLTVRTSDGVLLAYDEMGAGPPVVLVHGLGLSRKRWQRQVEALAEHGYRAVRFDVRGFGESELPSEPYGMDTLTADLATVAAHLGLDRFHLVGHSLGGMIAQSFALGRPDAVRTLTLASTTSHNGSRASEFAAAMSRVAEVGFDAAVAEAEVRGVLERVLAEAFPAGPPPVELLRRGLERPKPAHAYAWRATVRFSVKERLRELTCPVLVVHGTADPMIPWVLGAWIHAEIPGSRWLPLEGAGHSVQVERADDLNLALLEHLAAAEP